LTLNEDGQITVCKPS